MIKLCGACNQKMVKRKSGRWVCRECANSYQRKRYADAPELIRKSKRESMRRARKDPAKREAMNATRRGNEKHLAKGRQYNRRLKEHHFFKWRARLANRTGPNVTAIQLASLWKQQRGRCALSGIKLGRDAHLDHIHPKSKGGTTDANNLRWLDPWVNVALQDLTDEEFLQRCTQVAEWIGYRILEMERSQ